MSLKKNIKIRCEKCGVEFESDIYESINSTLNPELRNKFFNGEIFCFDCPHCQYRNYHMYPILYHNMDKKFMVQFGSIIECLEFYRQIHGRDNLYFEVTNNIINDYTITCATEYDLAKEKIAALENDLDHRFATIYRLIEESNFKEYARNSKVNLPDFSYLGYDDKSTFSVCMDVYDNEKRNCTSFTKLVDYNIYNEVANYYSKIINDEFNFLFTSAVARKILNGNIEKIKQSQKIKNRCLYLVNGGTGDLFFARTRSFIELNLQIGDSVLCSGSNNNIKKGIIIDKTELFTPITFPFDDEIFCVLGSLKKSYETSGNSDDIIDNDDLNEKLLMYNTNKIALPYDILRDSDVILGMIVEAVKYRSDENCYLKNNTIDYKEYLLTKNYKDGNYICLYLQQDKTPAKYNNLDVSKLIYRFDDIVSFAISSFEKYNGIVIDPEGLNIVLSNDYLLNVYIPDRVLTIDKRMIKLLETLTIKEINYLGKNEYKIISSIYFDNNNPKELSSKTGMPIEEIGKYITNGYKKLKDIVRYRYFK